MLADAAGAPWLIDPAAYGGHREVDLAMLRLFGAPGAARSSPPTRRSRRSPTATRSASTLWQLFPLLVHAVLFGGGYGASAERAARRYAGRLAPWIWGSRADAVVTGASRGIGAATARRCSRREGARRGRVSRARRDRRHGARRRRADRRAGAPAPVDILVNNAGTSFARALDELTDDDWNGQWELHVMASMRLMRAFAPRMAERGWGRIVNVASSAGKRPSLTNAAYSVTKAAQLSLSRVFADTYADAGRARQRGRARARSASPLWMAEGGLADQAAAAAGSARARRRSTRRRPRCRSAASASRTRSPP